MKRSKLITVILIILLILAGYLIYRYVAAPKMTIIIRYKEVPPVLQQFPRTRIDAYYRGYYIGNVSHINLSKDQKYILFYLNNRNHAVS